MELDLLARGRLVRCHQAPGGSDGKSRSCFLTSGAAACSHLAGSVLGVGSEHGRGVDQAFWAGVEQPQPRPAWEEGPPDRLDAKGRLIWVGFTEGQAASQG